MDMRIVDGDSALILASDDAVLIGKKWAEHMMVGDWHVEVNDPDNPGWVRATVEQMGPVWEAARAKPDDADVTPTS